MSRRSHAGRRSRDHPIEGTASTEDPTPVSRRRCRNRVPRAPNGEGEGVGSRGEKFNNEIDTIPTATALFHNNCMFTAHFILTSNVAKEVMGKRGDIGFSILVKRLQSLGEESIKRVVEQHKTRIVDLFQAPRVFDGLSSSNDSDSSKEFESAVKKTMLLLKKLESSWSTVLPTRVYNTMMSSIIEVVLDEVIKLLLSIEDFSSSTTDSVALTMKSLRHDLPSVLKEPHSGLPSLVSNAFKFLELERCLSSSLHDIVSRWGGGFGFGPLSVVLTSFEVRKLIRALFQNNQLRAKALDRIQDL
jgi:hypothetical protein